MFVCTRRPNGELLDVCLPGMRPAHAGAGVDEASLGPFRAWSHGDGVRPRIARGRYALAVGDVRLDNRAEVAALTVAPAGDRSDLALVLAAYLERGESIVERLAGDFAFVIWDARAEKLVAARDAFGVKPLYYRTHAGSIALADSTAPLERAGEYDALHAAELLAGGMAAPTSTIWEGVSAVAPGGVLVQRGTVRRARTHWSPAAFEPREGTTTADDVDAFRTLLIEAVRRQMGAPAETWAHLSGGLDSSAIVGAACAYGGGLAGTLTVVDTLGAGDERRYSDLVLRAWGVRNELVVDYWAWQEDGIAPPRLDEPWPLYPFFARDRRMRAVLRRAGARVLLAGVGSDHYLTGTLDYVRDMAARRPLDAARELAAWAAATRQSFWRLARRHVAQPSWAAWRGRAAEPEMPAWLVPDARTRGALLARTEPLRAPSPGGRAFATAIEREVSRLPAWFERPSQCPDIETRYPFLYKPLVEFALTLPRDARIRPVERKWILRQAMRDVLPPAVRARASKGAIDARVLWSLNRERVRIDELLRAPVLAELGLVSVPALRDAVVHAQQGICPNSVHLMTTLAVETWLAVRSGRWTATSSDASHAA